MKALRGTATTFVPTPVEQCFELIEALDDYPAWYPEVVKAGEVLARDGAGRPSQARAKLHVAAGPLVRDFDLLLAVETDPPSLVRLTRIPHDASDPEEFQVTWHLDSQDSGTRIRLELDANLSVPRLVPIGALGDSLAQGFVESAARALRS
jgi:ribosome-associated toxin RatA of RatAB toxin-antitoxin module